METYYSKNIIVILGAWILLFFFIMNDVIKFMDTSKYSIGFSSLFLEIAEASHRYIYNKENKPVIIPYKYLRSIFINTLAISIVIMFILGWWSAMDGLSKKEIKAWPIVLTIILSITLVINIIRINNYVNDEKLIDTEGLSLFINNKQKLIAVSILLVLMIIYLLSNYII